MTVSKTNQYYGEGTGKSETVDSTKKIDDSIIIKKTIILTKPKFKTDE